MPLTTTSLQHLGPLGVPGGAASGAMRLPGAALPGVDPQSLQNLRSTASKDPRAAVDQAARQFEALFMQELMKSMRQATMQSGLLENSGTQMGTDMLDSQFALKMTGLPGGLSQAIARQLLRAMDPTGDAAGPSASAAMQPGGAPAAGLALRPLGAPSAGSALPAAPVPDVVDARSIRDDEARSVARRSPQALQFTQQHTAAARAVQAESGIPAAFMIGQAAHETGWGRKEILHPDGRTSHNLFGIKAGAGWSGPVAEITTTEYIDGSPRKVTARFRAYASYEESFRDYARLMQTSQRYSGVMQDLATDGATVREFATGLQRAGYATDPAYADKLSRVINTTLHLQRSLG
jgi:peptidoglycan hydrolase FlgJ